MEKPTVYVDMQSMRNSIQLAHSADEAHMYPFNVAFLRQSSWSRGIGLGMNTAMCVDN